MSARHPMVSWVVWGGLAAIMVFIVSTYLREEAQKRDLTIDKPLMQLGEIGDFTLTNQLGEAVSRDDLMGHVWVADIIFTRCPGPCAYMSRRLQELQAAIPEDLPVKLVSLTTDPIYDTPEVLREYAQRFRADPDRWWFLTGPKAEVLRLAVEDLKLVLQEKEEAARESVNDLFIHSTLLVVVDRKGQLRTSFELLPRRETGDEESAVLRDAVAEEKVFAKTKEDIVKTVKRLCL